jgi:hypothetical protein
MRISLGVSFLAMIRYSTSKWSSAKWKLGLLGEGKMRLSFFLLQQRMPMMRGAHPATLRQMACATAKYKSVRVCHIHENLVNSRKSQSEFP